MLYIIHAWDTAFTAYTLSIPFSVLSNKFLPVTIPALFIKISTGPFYSSASLAALFTLSTLETSHYTAIAFYFFNFNISSTTF